MQPLPPGSPLLKLLKDLQPLFAVFTQGGEEMRLTGGCVRDALTGRPVQDVDAAVTCPPEETVARLEQSGIRAIPTGIAHGTVTALFNDRAIEITTLRRDIECDGRHAEVAFTQSWEEDAARRDFTMNALYVSEAGALFDYTGGLEDARAGHVRFIGDARARIREDALRILRFFRFYAWYGTPPINREALDACTELAALTDTLSAERIRHEMMKLLAAPDPEIPLAMMQAATLLPRLCGGELPLYRLKALTETERWLEHAPSPLVRLARLLQGDNTAFLLAFIQKRWKPSGKEWTRLNLLLSPSALLSVDEISLERAMRRNGREAALDALQLLAAHLCETRAEPAAVLRTTLTRAKNHLHWFDPPIFPVRGEDLLHLGFTPGKALGDTLHALEEYWESARYSPTRETLLARAKTTLN